MYRWRRALFVLLVATVTLGGECKLVIYVDGSNASGAEDGSLAHPYKTIQRALDEWPQAIDVCVFPGVYQGFALTGRQSVRVHGCSATVPIILQSSAGAPPLISITSSTDITLANLIVEGPGATASPAVTAVDISAGSVVTASAAIVRKAGIGILARDAGTVVTIRDLTQVEANRRGGFARFGGKIDVSNSTFVANDIGISGLESGSLILLDSRTEIINNGGFPNLGAIVAGGARLVATGTSFSGSSSFRQDLTAQDAGTQVSVVGASFRDSGYGVSATLGGTAEVSGSVFTGKEVGALSQGMGSLVVLSAGTQVIGSENGVVTSMGGSVIVDASQIAGSTLASVYGGNWTVAQIQDIVIRNGSVITGGAGHGIEAYAGNRVVVTNSRVSDHAGDGILCSKAECHVGDGAGLGNVISGHDTVGAFGIHCASGGIAYCDAGENTFANNTTDIDPACAATCPH